MNKRIILWVLIVVLLGLAIWLFLKKPTSPDQGNNQNLLEITEAVLVNPYQEYPMKKVIQSQEEFEAVFGRNEPGVDFTKQSIAFICLGKINTGGYRIEIDSIEKKEGQLIIHAKEFSPGKNCMVTQVISYPMASVYFEKLDLPVEWEIDSIIEDCP